MRYEAVIFDLFGTLVDSSPYEAIEKMLRGMARACGLEEQGFLRYWMGETRKARSRGEISSIGGCIEVISEKMGRPLTPREIQAAVNLRLEFTKQALTPRPQAIPTLKKLKTMGLKVGLVSDCSPDVPLLWKETELSKYIEAPVFSCLCGITKPDPRIYNLACKKLGVSPTSCLYVGDGDSEELTGANSVGMDAVMIRVPYDKGHRVREDRWEGRRIQSLQEVIDLIG